MLFASTFPAEKWDTTLFGQPRMALPLRGGAQKASLLRREHAPVRPCLCLACALRAQIVC